MPNEVFSQIKSVCYMILLLDSVGWKVDPFQVSDFWTQSLKQRELPPELIELMIFFWEQAGRHGVTNPMPPAAAVWQAIEKPRPPVSQTLANELLNQEMTPETASMPEPEPVQAAKRKPEEQTSPCLIPSLPTADCAQEPGESSGRYIYGIVSGTTNFEISGIDDNPVYLITHREIGALVHSCPPQPYESNDRNQVEKWLRQHQNVVDNALQYTDSLIPMSFDVIIDGSAAADPDDVLKQWLQERYDAIKGLLEQFSGRVEYGIKISGSIEAMTEKVTRENPEIIELNNRLATMSKGTAFLFRSELAQKIRKAVEEACLTAGKELCARIRPVVVDLKENKLEGEGAAGRKTLLNLAVLAEPDQTETIGHLLETIQNEGHYEVIFTGPWPAYSFVRDLQ